MQVSFFLARENLFYYLMAFKNDCAGVTLCFLIKFVRCIRAATARFLREKKRSEKLLFLNFKMHFKILSPPLFIVILPLRHHLMIAPRFLQ